MLWEKMLRMDKDSPVPFKADGTTLQDIEKRFEYEDKNCLNGYYPILFEPRLFYKDEQIKLF